MMETKTSLYPVLKWAGGKRQLLTEIHKYMPEKFNHYYEPFIGGGAVLFAIQPPSATICDLNPELINLYQIIKDYPEQLISMLQTHEEKHCKEYFYEVRSMDRNSAYKTASKVTKAARMVYLNRTCYNGLYRVNQKGFFNSPIGSYKNPKILDAKNIREISKYLNKADIDIWCGDYKLILRDTNKDDFVYLDPPYDPLSSTSSFTSYTKDRFGKLEQAELCDICKHLNNQGVRFMQSNSDTPFIRQLYADYNIVPVTAHRNINSKASKRSGISELLIMNY